MKLNDLTFFGAIDKLVTDAMKEFEERLLPTMVRGVKDTKIEVVDVPTEGHYADSNKLYEVLKHLRAFQNNDSQLVSRDIKKLLEIYSNPVFGIYPQKRTYGDFLSAYSNLDKYVQDQHVIISPMHDSLSLALTNLSEKGIKWDIQNVMEETENVPMGPNLVSFGIYIDQQYKNMGGEGFYNPVATTKAAESTVGSRAKAETLGIDAEMGFVNSDVYDFGVAVIQAYNKLFKKFRWQEGKGLKIPTKRSKLYKIAEDISPTDLLGKCVHIGTDNASPDRYYHWAIKGQGESNYPSCLQVVDFSVDKIVSSKQYTQKLFSELVQRKN